MTYEQALDHIHGLHRFGSRLGLTRLRRLLSALGDPHLGLQVIHVAGTNGKGSVSAMLASVLRAAGYRVGLYISPYVIDFRERISVNGEYISPGEVAGLTFGHVLPACASLAREGAKGSASEADTGPVTEFEFVTALGFLHYAGSGVDFVVAEVGLGGRFDATNVIDRPLLSVITAVGLDHTDRLGTTLRAIAAEKAGIIKRSAPVVSAPQDPEALEVIAAAARRRDCPLYLAATGNGAAAVSPAGVPRPAGLARFRRTSLAGQVIDYSGPGLPALTDLALPLLGRHQVENAATALTAAGVLKERALAPRLDDRAVRVGLAATVWPGRFEVFGETPPIIVDGAHNPPGAKCLAAALREHLAGCRLILVLGILADKDAGSLLSFLLPPALPEVAGVVTCRPPNPRAMEAARLAGEVSERCAGLPVEIVPEVAGALRRAVALAGPSGAVCVAGSLYQVGEARAAALEAAGVRPRRDRPGQG